MKSNGSHEAHADGAEPLSLVVPVFNEQKRLQQTGPALVTFVEGQPAGSRLIIVDDGSTDETAQVALALQTESTRVVYVGRPHIGKGAAVEFGLKSADTPISGYTDVDLSTPLHEVDRLYQLAATSGSLVIGSRGMPDTAISNHQTRRRELLGKLFNLWVRATITPGIKDTQCGAKFARREVWQETLAMTSEEGFAWDAEVVAQALHRGIGVREVGIEWSHDPTTRVRLWRDGVAMALSVPRIARRLARADQRSSPVWVRSET